MTDDNVGRRRRVKDRTAYTFFNNFTALQKFLVSEKRGHITTMHMHNAIFIPYIVLLPSLSLDSMHVNSILMLFQYSLASVADVSYIYVFFEYNVSVIAYLP